MLDEDEEIKMEMQWFMDCIEQYDYITMPSVVSGLLIDKMFQVLSIQEKVSVVPSLGSGSADICWTIQPLEMHGKEDVNTDTLQLDVFLVDVPQKLDVFAWFATDRPDRARIRIWGTQNISDIDNCISLEDSRPATPKTSLVDNAVPVLALLDALDNADWIGQQQLVNHTLKSGKLFDSRKPSKKRAYFQCVLASSSLFKNGQVSFKSNGSAAYYMAVFAAPITLRYATLNEWPFH